MQASSRREKFAAIHGPRGASLTGRFLRNPLAIRDRDPSDDSDEGRSSETEHATVRERRERLTPGVRRRFDAISVRRFTTRVASG
jgi:hypothetical protein